MKAKSVMFQFSALAVLILLSSCSFGLQPASSRDSAVVSVSLGGALIPSSAASVTDRALVQGTGYLYIRTLGGPTGDSGPFYGPYEASSGSVVKITDIPAGAYSDMYIIYSARVLNESDIIYLPAGFTFGKVMHYDDAAFTEFMSNADVNFRLFSYFDNEVSAVFTGKVDIRTGRVNQISSKLVPVTYGVNNIYVMTSSVMPALSTMSRKFFRLENFDVRPLSTETLPIGFELTAGSSSLNIGRCALYVSDGSVLRMFDPVGTIPTDGYHLFIDAEELKMDSVYYLYLEYSSASDFSIYFTGYAGT